MNFGIVLESKGCVFQCLLSAVNHIASYVASVSCSNNNTSLFPYVARVSCMLPTATAELSPSYSLHLLWHGAHVVGEVLFMK